MSAQELQVVKAFSSITVPEDVIRNSDIKGIVQDILSENEAVDANSRRLQRVRREKAEGNFFGNLWHGRSDKVDDAQSDLNSSIGKLTQKSSQLLVVNTAISKVLSDQQGVLLQQQRLLEKQTSELKKQNEKILDQQLILELQQKELNKANQGLLEAKGLTQEQALKLVGCVKRVEQSESMLEASNELLRDQIDQRLISNIQYIESVSERLESSQKALHQTLLQKISQHIEATDRQLKSQKQQLQEQNSHQIELIENTEKELIAKSDALQTALVEKIDQLQSDLYQQQKTFEASVESQLKECNEQMNRQAEEMTRLKDQLSEINAHQKATKYSTNLFKKRTVWMGALLGLISVSSLVWQILLHFALIP